MPKKTVCSDKSKSKIDEIKRVAANYGLEEDYFFLTTLDRYLFLLNILDTLKKQIEEDGALVTKEYVKGRANVYTHPAIGEYNKTVNSANQTLTTLIKTLNALGKNNDENEDADNLLKMINE